MERTFPTRKKCHQINLSVHFVKQASFFYSPVHMKVKPKVEPGKVKVHGKGVSTNVGIPASIPVDFTVDTTEAGFGDLEVQVLVCINFYLMSSDVY